MINLLLGQRRHFLVVFKVFQILVNQIHSVLSCPCIEISHYSCMFIRRIIQILDNVGMSIDCSIDIFEFLILSIDCPIHVFYILIMIIYCSIQITQLIIKLFNNLCMTSNCPIKFIKCGVHTGLSLLELLGAVD